MIGVLPREGQAAVVEEFFELFKTPWCWFEEGRAYDVVITTTEQRPASIDARLLLVFGTRDGDDARRGLRPTVRDDEAVLDVDGTSLPVFGASASFELPHGDRPDAPTADRRRSSIARSRTGEKTVIRVGFDLFDEVRRLLTAGQPVANAASPTIELHIEILRKWILSSGIGLVEVPPAPAGHGYAVCLTHDIDFVGIRRHLFDHSMWGFVFRATVGTARNLVRGRVTFRRAFDSWRAVASLPFVYLGWARDFWEPFEWYLRVEQGLPATYFLIPFKGRAGEHVPGSGASRRATAYDVADLGPWPAALERAQCELGVHGIDAWHSVERGRDELERLRTITTGPIGIRMHWLMWQEGSFDTLEEAGYSYDSTAGYNETVGYRNGTTQVFKPLGGKTLLELPMHVQDGALFYPTRLDLSEDDAWRRCAEIFTQAKRFGGVVTLLWHDRSHGPERFWGDFYARLIASVRRSDAWVGSAREVVDWFRARRAIRFDRDPAREGEVRLRRGDGDTATTPAFTVRVHAPVGDGTITHSDRQWDGRSPFAVDLPAACSVS
jgi:hypothetical protein